MVDVAKFPRYAAECLRLAREAGTIEQMEDLLSLAATWLSLFDECTQLEPGTERPTLSRRVAPLRVLH